MQLLFNCHRLKSCFFSIAIALTLAACGGGGSGGSGQGNAGGISDVSGGISINGPAHAVANTVYTYQPSIAGNSSDDFAWVWGDDSANSTGSNVSKIWRKNGSFLALLNANINGQTLSSSQGTRVAQPISAGDDHTCALVDVDLRISDDSANTNLGTSGVLCWGSDLLIGRALGIPGQALRAKPVFVLNTDNTTLHNALAIHASEKQTCALLSNGTVACWGVTQAAQVVAGLANITAMSLGFSHTCALQADGNVACLGTNDKGQLGNSNISNIPQATPAVVAGAPNTVALSAGRKHTCALQANSTVLCWGDNEKGQLGNGSLVQSSSPVPVTGLSDAIAITTGAEHSCALRSIGSVVCWGNSSSNQLGNGASQSQSSTPVAVNSLSDAIAISSSSASQHTCALRNSGAMVCWGDSSLGQLGNGTTAATTSPVSVPTLGNIVAITTGRAHTCALQSDATAFCWGKNTFGQLGNTSDSSSSIFLEDTVATSNTTLPSKVLATRLWNFIPNTPGSAPTVTFTANPTNTASITCADTPTALVTPEALSSEFKITGFLRGIANTLYNYSASGILGASSSELWNWGDGSSNSSGALVNKVWDKAGVFDLSFSATVANTRGTDSYQITMAAEPISASKGFRHTCALRADQSVMCWGSNFAGQLGDGTTLSSPSGVVVNGLSDVIALSTGSGHSCAIKGADRSVACWGNNNKNQLGDGTSVAKTTPSNVTSLTQISAIASGNDHSCAIRSNGSVACWGDNSHGQLGDGTTIDSATPKTINGLTAIAITAGKEHACALLTNGTVRCWGRNHLRQLGIGDNTASTLNTVLDLNGVIAISAGAQHTCALKSNQTIACWGVAASGRNGNGLAGTATICEGPVCVVVNSRPVTVANLTDAIAISAGAEHTCAVRFNGTLACWGKGTDGRLGNAQVSNKNSPSAVACLSNAVSVSAGLAHTCALKADGSSACWGSNFEGQLGNGSQGSGASKNTPTPVLNGNTYWK